MADRDEDPITYLTRYDPNDGIGDVMAKSGCLAFMCMGAASGTILLGLGIPVGIVWVVRWATGW